MISGLRPPIALLCLGLVSTSAARGDFAGIGLNVTGTTRTLTRLVNVNQDVIPPDTTGAVGPNHYVEFTNGAFAVYDKATGNLVGSRVSDASFWTSSGIASSATAAGLTDTRIVYDAASGRWFAAEVTASSNGNLVLIARSNTSDPTQGFKATSYAANAGFGDFPTLGLNATGVFVATNNFTSNSDTATFSGVTVTSIPKADLLLDTPTVANRTTFQDGGTTLGVTIQPVVDTGGYNPNGTLLAVSTTSSSQLHQTSILNPGAPTLSSTSIINVQTFSGPHPASQPDGIATIDANDSSISAIVYQIGGFLYTAHDTFLNNHDAIRWTKIDATTHAVVQEGTLADSSYDFLFPSIAANLAGDVVIGFTRTGTAADGFASSAAFIGSTTDHDPVNGTLAFEAAPHILMAGTANYHAQDPFGKSAIERWGDYSATSLDPSNPDAFWTIQEFAGLNNNWSTQITQIFVTPVPEPASLALLLIGVSAFAGRAWRRRLSCRQAAG